MNTLTLDGKIIAFEPGQTVLEAARAAGADIPTLCYWEACGPQTTCMVCVVKVNGKTVPACATAAEPGSVVESATPEIFTARRTALELLVSDHVSDCRRCKCQKTEGKCALQRLAQAYQARPGRYRCARREFRRETQPGGVTFEPGKCIRCGICVRLTEQAQEPLGLTFVGRGFDVRVSAPFDEAIGRGLQKVAAECVRACPTGALSLS